MNETLQLIDQLVAEHKAISEKAGSIEEAANDSRLLADLKKARDAYVPGQSNRVQSLQKLDEMLKAIDNWLVKHFHREETVLLPAVQKLGSEKLLNDLETRLFEHTDIRDRMYHSKKRIAELSGGELAPNLREATAGDIQGYLNHTIKLLTTHAENENRYLNELRKYIKKTGK